jgi:prolyl-tRNA synthetase
MYLNKEGKEVPMIMGCYGIGVGRLLASVLEVRADEDKILLPISIAPFEVELIGLHKDNQNNVKEICEAIYAKLKTAGIEVLYDDRNASPGFKFKDADLIGSPIKIALGEKSLQNGGAEVTIGNNEKTIVALDDLIDCVTKAKAQLYAELN